MSKLTTPTPTQAATHIVRPYVAREKDENEALPPANDLWQRPTYRTGDGDHTMQVPRPGSLRAFSLPSRGAGV